jgi:hypothetical protein
MRYRSAQRTRHLGIAVILAATGALALAGSANAMPDEPPATFRTAAAQSVKDPRQADMHASTVKKPTFPAAEFRGGDTPVDHPGASRAPTSAPTTIEVVRPVRTIVRDVDEALPLILSSTALLLVLVGLGITLVRIRMVPHPVRSD